MEYYICTSPIGKYEKDEVISGHKFKKLTGAEHLYFEPYDSNKPMKTFDEQIADNIQEDDKAERED